LKYKHISLAERERIYGMLAKEMSLRTIAKKIGRSHSCVARELSRNAKYGRRYIPYLADRYATRKALRQRFRAALKNSLVFVYVRQKLRLGWSPETIAGRLPIDHPGESIDKETIYRYIFRPKSKRMKLWINLAKARKKRMKKDGRKIRRNGRIKDSVSIDLRPVEIEARIITGHWETDNVEGLRTDTSILSTTVERTLRLTLLSKLNDRKANTKTKAIIKRMNNLPELLKKSITADNGLENSGHKMISKKLGVNFYFCHAYHSWEKGTVENTNGIIRRYIPKGTSIDLVTHVQIKAIENKLNNTPRKCLGYLTPYEKMNELVRNSNCIT